MLEHLKTSCEQRADMYLENWRDLNPNEIFKIYTSTEDTNKQESCFAALVVKYWHLISLYHNRSKLAATLIDCYEWLVDAILCAIKYKPWTDPSSAMYTDPNGPDKVLNRSLKCIRLRFYEQLNAAKRKGHIFDLSLEDKTFLDVQSPSFSEILQSPYDSVNTIIHNAFDKKNYFLAFMTYHLVIGNVNKFTANKSVDRGALRKVVQNTGDKDCIYFADLFDFDLNQVKAASLVCNTLSLWKAKKLIDQNIDYLTKILTQEA